MAELEVGAQTRHQSHTLVGIGSDQRPGRQPVLPAVVWRQSTGPCRTVSSIALTRQSKRWVADWRLMDLHRLLTTSVDSSLRFAESSVAAALA